MPETEPSSQDQGESEPQTQSESKPEQQQGRERRGEFELTDEKIDGMIGFLEQKNPEKAQELKQLQASDPEKFKAELKKVMREQFDKGERGGRGGRDGKGQQRRDGDTTNP